MEKLKAVFWDVDGTIADTEIQGHRLAFNKAFSDKGFNWNWDIPTYIDLLRTSGGKQRILKYSKKVNIDISEELINQIHQLKQSYYKKIVEQGKIKLRTGVRRLINELKQKHIKQIIVTTSSREALVSLLKSQIPDYKLIFSELITSEDVIKLKPYPDCYLKALTLSGLHPRDILAIEDSPNGVESALRAGLSCLMTLSHWDDFRSINESDQKLAITEHLGDEDKNTTIIKGPPIDDKYIGLNYLNKIIK